MEERQNMRSQVLIKEGESKPMIQKPTVERYKEEQVKWASKRLMINVVAIKANNGR